jgi:hypothetical protein
LVALAALGALGFSGCIGGEDEGPCVSDQQYFAEKVWAPILSVKCIGCHNPQGQAKDSGLVLRGSSDAGFLDTNYNIVKAAASLQQDGVSQVLAMPTGGTSARKHPGGKLFEKGSEDYAALEALVERFDAPSSCETNVSATFAGVQLATPEETLRKASLSLVGRLPTAAEEQAVKQGGIGAIDPILDGMMKEEAFYERLREIYNDQFLTDRYLGNEDAVNLLNDVDYYSPKWYYDVQDPAEIQEYIEKIGARNADDMYNKLRTWTNRGVAREPLELVVHVVKNDRPFTEILTANYLMVNPYSAKAFMLSGLEFKNDADPNEFVEAQIPNLPHAGVLTSPMFLNRYPTTDTNRNRARARMVYQFFLGTDILKTAEQPIDQTIISVTNPTMNDAQCTVCHTAIDPLAGAFRNWDDRARYNVNATPYDDMRPAGFGSETVPYPELPRALQVVAPQIANDGRFALAAVYTLFTGLTGQKPLIAPTDRSAPDFNLQFDTYLAQYSTFSQIANEFVENGYNLKHIVKKIVHSPYYRAKNAAPLSAEQQTKLADVGMGRFMIPEQLHRKIRAVLGYPWRPRAFEDGGGTRDFLLRGDEYRMLYGGIDSNDVGKRVTEPNGIMANISERMAHEMSCIAVPRDFWMPKEQRILFKEVDATFEPQDANKFDIEPAVAAIKANIVHLHKQILGETLDVNDPEIERTYQLFLQTYREGKDGMAAAEKDPALEPKYNEWLPWPCQVNQDYWTRTDLPEEERLNRDPNYVVRSWMTVVTYLLSDYKFLYE